MLRLGLPDRIVKLLKHCYDKMDQILFKKIGQRSAFANCNNCGQVGKLAMLNKSYLPGM